MKPLSQYTTGTQFGGGLNGGSTDIPRLYLDAARSIADKKGLSFACIYIDLKSAFASIVRGISLESLCSSEDLCHRLTARGFTQDDIREIINGLSDFSFWHESGGTHHLATLLARIHRCSWYAVEGVPGCHESHQGALAGTSLADVIFLLAFSRVLHAVEMNLSLAGVLFELPQPLVAEEMGLCSGQVKCRHLTPVAYVDDVAQPLLAKARDIIATVQRAMAVYHKVLSKYLLTINYSPGKTEVAFSCRGDGASKLKQSLQTQYADGIPVLGFEQQLFLRITRTYKHLGTVTSSDMSMQPEISSKTAAMRNAVDAIKGNFLYCPSIALEPRLLVLRSLVFSKGLFQAGSWPILYVSELSRLHKQIMCIYSSMVDAGISVEARRSHSCLLKIDGVVAPFVLLVCLRVRLFVRVVLTAPDSVLAVVFEARGGHRAWIDAVEHDLRFLVLNSEAFFSMIGASMKAWVDAIRANPRTVLRPLKSAATERRINSPSTWARSKRLKDLDAIFQRSHCDEKVQWRCPLPSVASPSRPALGPSLDVDTSPFRLR